MLASMADPRPTGAVMPVSINQGIEICNVKNWHEPDTVFLVLKGKIKRCVEKLKFAKKLVSYGQKASTKWPLFANKNTDTIKYPKFGFLI